MEVFMVQRHHQVDFATGALVFPGGKADPADASKALRDHCDGADALDDVSLSIRACGIRETFEEAGVLLAREEGSDALVGGERLATLERGWRGPLHSGERTLLEFVREERLRLACDALCHFAHWITPVFMPKRFDTHFYLAKAPADQLALHDGHESVDSVWTTVDDAIGAEARGERTIIFPTLVNLQKLGRSRTVDEAFTAARARPIVTVLPTVEKNEEGVAMMRLPEEADYDIVEAPLDSLR
jgi:8-oxo-dGTP pyrophosphatase MutT (NUDIX family)